MKRVLGYDYTNTNPFAVFGSMPTTQSESLGDSVKYCLFSPYYRDCKNSYLALCLKSLIFVGLTVNNYLTDQKIHGKKNLFF